MGIGREVDKFFNYFNGSKYYTRRDRNQKKHKQNAEACIKRHGLNGLKWDKRKLDQSLPYGRNERVFQNERRDLTYIFNDYEIENEITAEGNLKEGMKDFLGYGTEYRLKDKRDLVKKHLGLKWRFKGTSAWMDGPIANYAQNKKIIEVKAIVRRYGLYEYTNLRGEIEARADTNYAMDLITSKQIAIWNATLIASMALALFPFTMPEGLTMAQSLIVAVSTTIIGIITDIVITGGSAQVAALTYETLGIATGTFLYAKAASPQENQYLHATNAQIYQGLTAYAGNAGYAKQSAGSQSYAFSKAYNASAGFASEFDTQKPHAYEDLAQNRAHYSSAGNEGYTAKIIGSDAITYAKITKEHSAPNYRWNILKEAQRKLLFGYSELANYISGMDFSVYGENYEDNDNLDAKVFAQRAFDGDYHIKRDEFMSYMQKKDFLGRLENYSKALRADFKFFSIQNTLRAMKKSSFEVDIDGTKRAELDSESNESQDSPKDLVEIIYTQEVQKLASEKLEQERAKITDKIELKEFDKTRNQRYFDLVNGKGEDEDKEWSDEKEKEHRELQKRGRIEVLKRLDAKLYPWAYLGNYELNKYGKISSTLPMNFNDLVQKTGQEQIFYDYFVEIKALENWKTDFDIWNKSSSFGFNIVLPFSVLVGVLKLNYQNALDSEIAKINQDLDCACANCQNALIYEKYKEIIQKAKAELETELEVIEKPVRELEQKIKDLKTQIKLSLGQAKITLRAELEIAQNDLKAAKILNQSQKQSLENALKNYENAFSNLNESNFKDEFRKEVKEIRKKYSLDG